MKVLVNVVGFCIPFAVVGLLFWLQQRARSRLLWQTANPPHSPSDKADQLLRSMLDEDQRRTLETSGYIPVGRRSRILCLPYQQVQLWERRWGVWHRSPVDNSGLRLPAGDQALNFFLHLKAHPRSVRWLPCGSQLGKRISVSDTRG